EAREKYGNSGKEPAPMYIGPTDRRNQSFLTGILLTGVPLLILWLFPYVRRWRRRLPGAAWKDAAAAGAERVPGKATATRVRVARWFVLALALAAAVAIAA